MPEETRLREGIGLGFGRAPQPEIAHDIALKAAETDATKWVRYERNLHNQLKALRKPLEQMKEAHMSSQMSLPAPDTRLRGVS